MIYEVKEIEKEIEQLKANKEGSLLKETDSLFIGIGKAGCNTVFELKDVISTGYLNTSSDDLRPFQEYNKKLCLKFGNAEGAGKMKALSKQMAEKDNNKINIFIDSLSKNTKNIFLVYSVGGGTGIGAAKTVAENYKNYYKDKYNKSINIILVSLNATKNEKGIVAENEYHNAKELIEWTKNNACIVIDNNYMINNKNKKDYEKVNKNFLITLLRFFEKAETYNNDRIDAVDVLLSLKQSGYIYMISFNINKEISLEEQIKSELNNSVFYKANLKTAKRINYILKSNSDTIDSFDEHCLREIVGNGGAVTITPQIYKNDNEDIFTLGIFGTNFDKSLIENAHNKYKEYLEHSKINNSINIDDYEIETEETENEEDIEELKSFFDL